MKISCNIIRDLLPLYAEDLASEDTRAMVDAHLCDCADCTDYLGSLKQETAIPVETTSESLKKVKNTIRRKRILSVLAALLTLLSLSSLWNTFLHAPIQLTMEQALDDFYVREDGAIIIDYSPWVTGRSQSGWNENWFINQHSTRFDIILGNNRPSMWDLYGGDGIVTEDERQRYENIEIIYGHFESADGKIHADGPIPGEENGGILVTLESEKNWWYSDPTGMGNDILLHDAGQEQPDREDRILFSPVYPILFFGGILLSLICLLLNRFTEKPRWKELSMRFLILSSSLVVSILFVSGGRIFTSYVGVIDQYWGWFIGMDSIFLTLTLLFWRQLHLLNKLENAM